MSIVCGAIKGNEIAIACDSQANFGSTKVSTEHLVNTSKLYHVNDSIIGIVGWDAISNIIEHLITNKNEIFKLDNRMDIYSTLIKLHELFKDDYFVETSEEDDQPVESNQLDAIIINKNGLFQIGSYREVNQFRTFWAIGSGKRFAIGAMHAIYSGDASAKKIVEAGVKAAAEFDDGCNLPLLTEVISI